MYEIIDGEVLDVQEVKTEVQTAIVKRGLGRDKKIILSVDKPIIADGVDKAIVSARLQDWQGNDIDQAVAVMFEVNGVPLDKETDAHGVATIEFSSLTPGVFPVSCSAPGYDTGVVEVVVNEA